MGAGVDYRFRVQVIFETEFEGYAVTKQEAIEEFNAAVEKGRIGTSELDLDTTRMIIRAFDDDE